MNGVSISATATPRVCAARSCTTALADELLMCGVHWTLVSAALRDSIAATCKSDPAHDTTGAGQYRRYVAAAIAEVAHKEARQQSRRPPSARKPVQLPLFEIGTIS